LSSSRLRLSKNRQLANVRQSLRVNAFVFNFIEWLCDCSYADIQLRRGPMLRIQRASNGKVIFTIIGRIDAENIAELKRILALESKGTHMVMNLKDLELVNRDAVLFLAGCEAERIRLKNCPTYIREWINREQGNAGQKEKPRIAKAKRSRSAEKH
jgi:hypothetical protein